MAINDLTYTDVSAVLAAINAQATGRAVLAPTNTADFVALAQTTLKQGYDIVTNAISQVLSRTIFSIRPYERKFRGIEADSIRWGNHVRKINYIDDDPVADRAFLASTFVDGQSVDQYTINKKKVVQTNFYGQTGYSRYRTYYRHQLNMAFTGPDELARFWAGVTQSDSDMIEKDHENFARMALANYIGGRIAQEEAGITSGSVVHLLSEYNAWSGDNLTIQTVFNSANFEHFVRWMWARIQTLSDLMTERSSLYHQTFADPDGEADLRLERHTPRDMQRLYLNTGLINQADANVLSMTRQPGLVPVRESEMLNYWQNINNPLDIDLVASYTTKAGEVTSDDVKSSIVMGLMLDREAVGYTITDAWTQATPMNAAGGYYDQWYHYTDRYWNDFSENGIVLLLD